MPLASCPRCKKMFNRTDQLPVCSNCTEAEEADYEKVRDVISRIPGISGEDAAKEADVKIDVVQRMLKEGVVAAVNPLEKILCGRCGEQPAISAAKKLCQVCLDKLNAEVAMAQRAIKIGEKKQAQVGEYLSARRSFDEKHQ